MREISMKAWDPHTAPPLACCKITSVHTDEKKHQLIGEHDMGVTWRVFLRGSLLNDFRALFVTYYQKDPYAL